MAENNKVLSQEEWFHLGVMLYGPDLENWEFKCFFCNRVQSVKSIREEQAKGILSKRYGKLNKGDEVFPEQCCYSPKCDYVSNGLLTTGVLVVNDTSKPHDEALKKNCCYVLPFAKGMDENHS